MTGIKYQKKDKKIKIFYEFIYNDTSTKRYIHPENATLAAYVRQLSASEQTAANAIRDGSALQFVINPREIKTDMLVEFREKTYQIGPPDLFEFYKTEVKFIAFEVTPKEYDNVEGSEW